MTLLDDDTITEDIQCRGHTNTRRHERLPSYVYHKNKDPRPAPIIACHKSDSTFSDASLLAEKAKKYPHISLTYPSTMSTVMDPEEKPSQKQVQANDGWIAIFMTGVKPLTAPGWPVVFTYIMATLLFVAFSGELLMNKDVSGEFIELDPFNVMIGPSLQILVQSGARFTPCMRNTTDMPPLERYVCLNTTSAGGLSLLDMAVIDLADPHSPRDTCSLEDICGVDGFYNASVPDQSFRFLTALFVHSGLLHFIFNFIAHMILGVQLERILNPIKLAAVYLASGIFGNIFGANFASSTLPSMGCSGALFGLEACLFVDVGLNWQKSSQPFRHIIKLIVFTACSFVLGLIPGVDNFSHIGGFIAGLLLGIVFMPTPPLEKRSSCIIFWIVRIIALLTMAILFAVLTFQFYATTN
ncbi:uncharacterized protein BYT42DRAFT_613790 [Radiomyces spectabilis]|uniref:uncharacterized protein n=1 Tax=Radiomyces spectabilis TaxID=64574 RepID=UPI00221E5862|nr:uncharacterized protein BYT42DRAFT_613790 [Radiomyces spectabilis]KAI8379488.1 hypothetical protein BYT42DRAFT_613790 [Radiomyces spectabilis]